ncbi:MFS transporter [Promethearchaeum syntrophicum]|uniref:MFS transporter n=1 Tax=Promethearchaeum syntrophicum TaxID=2594042 RepID=A0A5B9D7U6_9ARCH|nr:MFS transporter [Candidatus Prometheoarchaeum syntrophicum]
MPSSIGNDDNLNSSYKPRMSPNTPGKLNYGRTFLIGLAFMTSSIVWAYYNFIMPILLKEFFIDIDAGNFLDLYVGIIMVLDNIIAVLMIPYFGAISDRAKSKLGKRTPFIIIGCISAVISFSILGIISDSRGIGPFIGLISVIIWFNFSMSFYRSASISVLPDLTDPEVRSTGNAIINTLGAISMVIGLVIPIITGKFYSTQLLYQKDLSRALGFYLVSIATAIALGIFLLTVKETPTGEKFLKIGEYSIAINPITLDYLGEQEKNIEKKEKPYEILKIIFKESEKSTLFMLIVIFTSFLSQNALETYYSLYATSFLGLEEGEASSVIIIAPIVMIITAIPAGKIAEKFGRKKTIFLGLIGLSICSFFMIYLKNLILIRILMGFMGIFFGFVIINSIVIIWQMAPKGKIGAYTGVYYLFSQLSATFSPLIAGSVFSLYKIITDCDEGFQYVTLFPYIILWEIVAIFFLNYVKQGESKKFTTKQINALRIEHEN